MDHQDAYQLAWSELRTRVLALGHRAWLFRAALDAARFIEFVEWKQESHAGDPRADVNVRASLDRLAHFGKGQTELWIGP